MERPFEDQIIWHGEDAVGESESKLKLLQESLRHPQWWDRQEWELEEQTNFHEQLLKHEPKIF